MAESMFCVIWICLLLICVIDSFCLNCIYIKNYWFIGLGSFYLLWICVHIDNILHMFLWLELQGLLSIILLSYGTNLSSFRRVDKGFLIRYWLLLIFATIFLFVAIYLVWSI